MVESDIFEPRQQIPSLGSAVPKDLNRLPLLEIRPFLNSDPPALAKLWNAQPPSKRLIQPAKIAVFEHLVLAKPYFDRLGLLLAIENSECIGFVHAGFGPNDSADGVNQQVGVISMLLSAQHVEQAAVQAKLLEAAEGYLASKGAATIHAVPTSSLAVSYNGLSQTGDELGVLDEDTTLRETLLTHGYEGVQRHVAFRRDLENFRAVPNRRQRALARTHDVNIELDQPDRSWWNLCRYGPIAVSGFHIVDRATKSRVGEVTCWDQSIAGIFGVANFNALNISQPLRRNGLGTLLMNESMKQLKNSGVKTAQTVTNENDDGANAFFESIGFSREACGTTFVRSIS